MATSKAAPPPADKLDLYERLVATRPGAELKGVTMPYTSVNGHMYSYLGQDGKLALRLPAAERTDFLRTYGATLREAHGRIQAEYVEVPDSLLVATEELKPYFDQSHAYVSSLKPKPTTRKGS